MKSDADLRKSIESELQWDLTLDSRRIAIVVRSGVVTLSGRVASADDRCTAEVIAACVTGVRGISNDIQVDIGFPAPAPELFRSLPNLGPSKQ